MNLKIRSARIISSALAVIMGITLIPWLQKETVVRADGIKNKDNTKLGVSQIAEPAIPENMQSSWSGSYIYYGKYEGSPIKFRVLDTDSDIYGNGKKTVFLDSDKILFESPICIDAPEDLILTGPYRQPIYYGTSDSTMEFVKDYRWGNSDLKKYLNGSDFLENRNIFTETEENAIANSYVSTHDLVMGTEPGNVDYDAYHNFVESEGLTGEKIFILDVEDILNDSYGYYLPKNPTINNGGVPSGDTSGINAEDFTYSRIKTYKDLVDGYWLRSHYKGLGAMGDVWTTGYLYCDSIFTPSLGVAPAMNLDQDSILFSTVIVGKAGEVGATYKLTIKDPDLHISYPSDPTFTEKKITVPYEITGKNVVKANQISVLITDKDYNDSEAEILYYEKLSSVDIFSTKGTGSFILSEGLDLKDWGTAYHVYIFPETINDLLETDYAGDVIEVTEVPSESIEQDASDNDDPSIDDSSIDDPSNENTSFEGFVERLYNVALGRESESDGKTFWVDHVKNGDLTGADCAREFLNSAEFNDRNLTDEEFLSVLYEVFFDRNAQDDPTGFNYWLNVLETESRSAVVNGFINSTEWCNVCAFYGVRSGASTAKATVPSINSIEFVKRLYTTCLGREADSEGLIYWSLGLTNQELTGTQAVREFIYSKEFQDSNYDNEEYISRLYGTFMGREPDNDGFTYWINLLEGGTSRNDVFDSFARSNEFAEICNSYAIQR